MQKILARFIKPFAFLAPQFFKGTHEYDYWRQRHRVESGQLSNEHYKYFYTTFFSLNETDYDKRRVLDIGCGPRGSLEWASSALERIGLDPLAHRYLSLGADQHAMTYVKAPSEDIPFEDGRFDVVCAFNSLDHVADIDLTIKEIKRVCRPDGLFLLITEINHESTPTEPQEFGPEIVEKFRPDFHVIEQKLFGLAEDHDIYGSIQRQLPYMESGAKPHPAILCAKFKRLNNASS